MTDTAAFRDKVIVITGASSGFGRGAAVLLASQGASVVIAARRSALLDALAQECNIGGGVALPVPTDVSNAEEMEALAQAAVERFGRIDAWVNNAGVGAIGPFEKVPLADHEQVLRTNLFGTLYGSYAAVHQFRKQNSGILINVSSMLGKVPSPYYASYSASKHGIIGLTTTIRLELEELKLDAIRICLVLPMAMDSPFFEHAGNYTGREAVPIPPVYDAGKVVEAITALITHPQNEVVVGGAGVLANIAHHLAPGLVEKMTAREIEQVQMKHPAKTVDTSGNIHQPVMAGSGLHTQAKH